MLLLAYFIAGLSGYSARVVLSQRVPGNLFEVSCALGDCLELLRARKDITAQYVLL